MNENPVDTVVKLLADKMNIAKNGGLAKISVSREWLSQEALQSVDGHVTVGLAESIDNKLELTGKLRRRLVSLRVNVWSLNSQMRFKIVEEVLRVVRENRKSPGGNLSYLDVVSYRDIDRVDVKPFVYRTELVLKSWVFENIGV
jgi:hypothetical protein